MLLPILVVAHPLTTHHQLQTIKITMSLEKAQVAVQVACQAQLLEILQLNWPTGLLKSRLELFINFYTTIILANRQMLETIYTALGVQ